MYFISNILKSEVPIINLQNTVRLKLRDSIPTVLLAVQVCIPASSLKTFDIVRFEVIIRYPSVFVLNEVVTCILLSVSVDQVMMGRG